MRKIKKAIKRKLLKYGKKHHTFLTLLRKAMFVWGRVQYLNYYYSNKVDDKMIMFEAYMGRYFVCSPKAIYNAMQNDERCSDFKYVWAFKNPDDFKYLEENKNTVVVKYGSRQYYRYHAAAKFWVTNSRLKEIIKKKDDQVYIQCWHGTPLKKLGYDISVKGGNAMNSINDIRKKYKTDSKRYTYMISPSAFCTEKFASAFDLEDKSILKETGYPRNDFLYNYTQQDVAEIKDRLGIKGDRKIILYAPTWRDDQHKAGMGYVYKAQMDFDKMQREFGDEYIILFRTHYFVANYIDLSKYEGFVYNVSTYDDINDLYIISDLLITDYSSVFFDYSNLKRPIYFYMYDFDEYKNNLRDFYIDLSELPGPITKTQDELMDELKNISTYESRYREIYDKFNARFTYHEDGHSSVRVIEQCILSESK